MSKKMRVILSILAAVMVLTLGGAAAVLAQEGENTLPDEEATIEGDGPSVDVEELLPLIRRFMPQADNDGLLAKVAGILDIPEADLKEAFQQARQEMRQAKWEDAFQQALTLALEEGLITPEEAEEIREWWTQKPEVLDAKLFRHLFRFTSQPDQPKPGVRLGQRPEIKPQPWPGMGLSAGSDLPGNAQPGLQLNEKQAVKIREWLQNRPESSNGRPVRARIFNALRGQPRTGNQGNDNGQFPFQLEE
ncbi:MAG: hypothetical protein V3R92_03875 [Dehalococcoidales bacterium]